MKERGKEAAPKKGNEELILNDIKQCKQEIIDNGDYVQE